MVPTADDVERFERELAEDGSTALGGKILTFSGLVRELAGSYGIPHPNGPGHPARVWLAREAVTELLGTGELKALAESAVRPGFAPALADSFDELEAAMILPDSYLDVVSASEMATSAERELGTIYERWFELKSERTAGDSHALYRSVRSAIRDQATDDPWLGRPVFLYGFDDLTNEQRELILELARKTEVRISVTFDERRPALEARARLKTELEQGIPSEFIDRVETVDGQEDDTEPLLAYLAEKFFSDASRLEATPDSGLTLMKSAGVRSEAEFTGSKIVELVGQGVELDEIAVVLRSPERYGRQWAEVFETMGIPTAVEARVAARSTSTGRAINLLAQLAGGDATPADLVSYLRSPGRAPRRQVDELERLILTRPIVDLEDAEACWREEIPNARDLFELSDLRTAGNGKRLLSEAARLVSMISQYPMRGESPIASGRQSLELRSGGEIARALDEVAALDPRGFTLENLPELIGAVSVSLHSGPAHGRVRIASPYRFRAQRVRHLFACSLQDRDFPKRSSAAQLISDEVRGELRLPERTQPMIEERYLFASALSRPREGLWLSWREIDEEGGLAAPSPFIEDVRDLLSPERDAEDLSNGRDPLFELIGQERGLGDVVIDLQAAASDLELSRTLASLGREQSLALLDELDLPEQRRDLIHHSLTKAVAVTEPERLQPRDFHYPEVLARLAGDETFGATTLESYLECPYRWLVGHQIEPDELSRRDSPMQLGSVAHAALERIFTEQPGGPLRELDQTGTESRPRKGVLVKWQKRVVELVDEILEDLDLGEIDVFRAASVLALKDDLARYLEAESERKSTFMPSEGFNELRFGFDGSAPPLELDGLRIHGAIDRIDLEADDGSRDGSKGAPKRGLVVDYKYSSDSQTTARTMLRDSKLQAQLYALAARELLEIDPAGSLYVALRKPRGSKPRGFLDQDLAEAGIPKGEVTSTDFLETPEFEDTLAEARAEAERIAADIKRGHLDREPNQGVCHRYCRWQPICRIERRYGEDEQ